MSKTQDPSVPAAGSETDPWPTELSFQSATHSLRIAFDDGVAASIPFELLRVESPSAEVQGHGGEKPPPVSGKRNITVSGVEPVGRYAVRIRFSDGHNTGLYSWALLYDLARDLDARMNAYLERLKSAGLARD